jgi:NAD(P)-dependent dehydrogenase (short-subunit alcohol dehydrogenase family)
VGQVAQEEHPQQSLVAPHPVGLSLGHPVLELAASGLDNPEAAGIVEGFRKVTLTERLGTIADVVDACLFLLENAWVNSIDLRLDGGRR